MARKQSAPINGRSTRFKSGRDAVEAGRKGGIASGVARREQRQLINALQTILSMPLHDGDAVEPEYISSYSALKGENISVMDAIAIAQVNAAMKGDSRAAKWVIDTLGTDKEKDLGDTIQIIDDFLV